MRIARMIRLTDIRPILFILALALGGAALSGCETVKGAGQDLQNLGEAGQDAIDGDG